IDSKRNIAVVGYTASSNFPLVNPFQSTYGGSQDGVVALLSSDGSSLLFSPYLGGTGGDSAESIVTDRDDSLCVTGTTQSTDFPTLHPPFLNTTDKATNAG